MSDSDLLKKEETSADDLEKEHGADFSADEQNRINALSRQLGDNDEVPYTDEGPESNRLRGGVTKKKGLIGTLVGLLLFGGAGIFTILQGPGELVQLGQVLSKFSRPNDSAISLRSNGFLRSTRAAKTGDVGQTRISYIGSRRVQEVRAQLKNVGIEFQGLSTDASLKSLTIEASKNSAFSKGSLSQNRAAIAKFYSVDISKVQQYSGLEGGKFRISALDMKATASRSLVFSSLKHAEDGRILGAMNKRYFAQYFRVPSLWHPLERAKINVEKKLYTRAASKVRESERQNKRKAQLKQKYSLARTRINDAVAPHRTAITGALFVTGALCVIKGVADQIPIVNYSAVVAPAMLAAVDKQAVGSQTQSSQDFDLDQLGDVKESLVDDEGKTIWEGKALDALANGGPGEGVEMDEEYKQAFSGNTNSSNIRRVLEAGGATDLACSPGGLLVQGAISIGLIAIGPGGWAAKAAQFTASTVATAAAIGFLQNKALDGLTVDPVEAFSGPMGGNLLAYGARAGHNLNAISMGGVELSQTETSIALQEMEAQERHEFGKKSFFARIFDVNDYRSLASGVARSPQLSSGQSLSAMASGIIKNPFNVIGKSFGALMPKANAAEEPYDWDSPLYSVPRDILNNDKYDDPLESAEVAAGILASADGEKYIAKARKCFGVVISKGAEGWDVQKNEEVNPSEDDYRNAGCNNMSDENWVRTMLFVFDTSIMTLIDCYEGGEESCRRIGEGGVGPQSESGSSGLPSGDAKSLAEKLLALEGSKVSFTTTEAKQNLIDTAGGKEAQIERRCTNAGRSSAPLSATLLGVLLKITEKHSIGIGYINNGCHTSSESAHYAGRGVDLNTIDGRTATGGDADRAFMQEITGILPDGSGMGEVQCSSITIKPINRVNLFEDSCNHLHFHVPN